MHNCQLNLILNHPLALGQMTSRYFDLYRPFFCLGLGDGTTNIFFFHFFCSLMFLRPHVGLGSVRNIIRSSVTDLLQDFQQGYSDAVANPNSTLRKAIKILVPFNVH
jgi:hypothetical protein